MDIQLETRIIHIILLITINIKENSYDRIGI